MVYVQYDKRTDQTTVTSWGADGRRDVLLRTADIKEVQSLLEYLENDGEDYQVLKPKD